MDIKVMDMNNEHTDDIDTILSLETVKAIERSLTINTHLILEALYRQPYMRQKDLSTAVYSSPSSLSNQLNKIYSISPPLIGFEQRGRDKFFFLTSEGTAYMRQELKKSSNRMTLFPLSPTSPAEPQYNGVKIPNDIYDNAIKDSLRDYINLAPLLDLEETQPASAHKIVDDIFIKLFPSVFPSKQPERKLYTASLTDEQYYAIYFTFSQFTLHYINKDFDKEDFVNNAQTILGLHDIPNILFYLAEKMDRIHAMRNSGDLL